MPTIFPFLKKEFLRRFAEALSPLGFKKVDQRFYKQTLLGHNSIWINFLSYPGKAIGVNLEIGVRFEAVELLSNEFSPGLPKKLKRWTTTVGNRLDNLMKNYPAWTWHISNEVELEEVLSIVMKVVKKIILPYFKRFSTLEAALEVLSPDDDDARRHCIWEPTQAKRAVAVAFVLGKRKEFEEIAERKLKMLQRKSEHNEYMASYIPNYIIMVEELRNRWSGKSRDII